MTAPVDPKLLLFQSMFADAKKRGSSAKRTATQTPAPAIQQKQPPPRPPSPTETIPAASTLRLDRDETPSEEDDGERFDDVEVAMPAQPPPSIAPPRASKAVRRQSIRTPPSLPAVRPTTPRTPKTPKRQAAAAPVFDEEIALSEEAQIVDNGTDEISAEVINELDTIDTKSIVRQALARSKRCLTMLMAPFLTVFILYKVMVSQL